MHPSSNASQREAAAVARLRHPNIVQVHDFGITDGITYMVMEYIAGMTLKERLTTLRVKGLLLPLARGARLHVGLGLGPGSCARQRPGASRCETSQRHLRGSEADGYEAILTDFGIAKMLEGVQFDGDRLEHGHTRLYVP